MQWLECWIDSIFIRFIECKKNHPRTLYTKDTGCLDWWLLICEILGSYVPLQKSHNEFGFCEWLLSISCLPIFLVCYAILFGLVHDFPLFTNNLFSELMLNVQNLNWQVFLIPTSRKSQEGCHSKDPVIRNKMWYPL